MNKLHIIAGLLAFFFLAVAIFKSIAQANAKREAKRKSIEQAKDDAISLHNPYPGEIPVVAPESESEDGAPADNAQPETQSDAPPAVTPPPQEQIYKWN